MFAEHCVRESMDRRGLLFLIALLLVTPAITFGASFRDLSDVSATHVIVTTTSEVVDGATTSITDLNANLGPDAAISLREALLAANTTDISGTLTVAFNIPTTAPGYDAESKTWTISLQSALPPLTRGGLRIDGATQPGAGDHPPIVLDGTNVYEDSDQSNGVTITSAGNVLHRLTMMNFFDSGVLVSGEAAAENQISGSYIGVSPTGDTAQTNGTGVTLRDGAHTNLIGGAAAEARNVIAGNGYNAGVYIHGSATYSNTVAGNWIGVNASGAKALPNAIAGVRISSGAYDNRIGGAEPGAGNVISGNDSGVWVQSSATNTIAGNHIGVAADGLTPLGNTNSGIIVRDGARNNIIGGDDPAERNIIANNAAQGVYITGSGSDNNRVQGNYLGTNQTGIAPGQGNLRYGVLINDGATGNIIGGNGATEGNIIVYNGFGGIRIDSPANRVGGNRIGVAADGVTRLGNQNNGVRVFGNDNQIGPANTILYNHQAGVMLSGNNTTVLSNTIELNGQTGVCVVGAGTVVSGNTINRNGGAGAAATECNIEGGVVITGTGTLVSDNTIHDNIGAGITVRSGDRNRLSENSITGSTDAGIVLENGGNNGVAPPTIMSATATVISGKGCPFCAVEIFADTGNQGKDFLSSTQVAADSTFSVVLSPGISSTSRFVTATTTDTEGNTSPFAPAMSVAGQLPYRALLPLMVRDESE